MTNRVGAGAARVHQLLVLRIRPECLFGSGSVAPLRHHVFGRTVPERFGQQEARAEALSSHPSGLASSRGRSAARRLDACVFDWAS